MVRAFRIGGAVAQRVEDPQRHRPGGGQTCKRRQPALARPSDIVDRRQADPVQRGHVGEYRFFAGALVAPAYEAPEGPEALPPAHPGAFGGVPAHRLQGHAVGISRAVALLNIDRVVGRRRIQLGESEAARLVPELARRPAAEHGNPVSLRRRFRTRGNHRQGPGPARDAIEADLALVIPDTADEMKMIVDQAGDHRLAPKFDDPGIRTLVAGHRPSGTDRDNPAVIDGQTVGDGEFRVHRQYSSVRDDDVRRLRRSFGHRNKRPRENRQRGEKMP